MRQIKKRPPQPFKRRVHINGVEWSYVVGRGGITVRSLDGETKQVNMSEFTGLDWQELERAAWKGFSYPVQPSDIVKWIKENWEK